MKIVLIRHGETQMNKQGRYSGWTDCPLSARGRRQASETARRLKKENIRRVYSSDLKRASEFARIVFKKTTIQECPELREMNFGIFEGLTHAQILRKFPDFYRKWLSDPRSASIPQGESFKRFERRIRRFLKKITAHGKNKAVAVVTHAGPIRVILKEGAYVPNGSVSVTEYHG